MKKIAWEEKVTNKYVLERIGEKKTLQNNIPHRKVNLIECILIRRCFIHNSIERQLMETKGVGRRRRRTSLLASFRNRGRYWKLKEETEDRKGENDSLSHKHKEEL